MDDEREHALSVALEYARRNDLDHAGGAHEDGAWIVARLWRSGRVTVWRVRPAESTAGITVALSCWEFSDEELETEALLTRGGRLLSLAALLQHRGIVAHPVD
ncbi:MAG: hypothetical protein KGL39_17470 [Patescibacteria group bacterium]|nr:hypothetical protein [Patescibacteria group bacterium]